MLFVRLWEECDLLWSISLGRSHALGQQCGVNGRLLGASLACCLPLRLLPYSLPVHESYPYPIRILNVCGYFLQGRKDGKDGFFPKTYVKIHRPIQVGETVDSENSGPVHLISGSLLIVMCCCYCLIIWASVGFCPVLKILFFFSVLLKENSSLN